MTDPSPKAETRGPKNGGETQRNTRPVRGKLGQGIPPRGKLHPSLPHIPAPKPSPKAHGPVSWLSHPLTRTRMNTWRRAVYRCRRLHARRCFDIMSSALVSFTRGSPQASTRFALGLPRFTLGSPSVYFSFASASPLVYLRFTLGLP